MPQLTTQFVVCPKCNGLGKNEKNLVCPECGQLALGTFIKNYFLYWGYDLTPSNILVRQSKVIFDGIINITLLLFAASGFLAIGWWFFQNEFQTGALLSFWGMKDGFIAWFWAGALAGMFVYFRWRQHQKQHPSVKVLYYRSQEKLQKKVQRIPNNWQELKRFKTKIDISASFSKELLKIIDEGYQLAESYHHRQFLPAHLILAAINSLNNSKPSGPAERTRLILSRLNIHQDKIGPKIKQNLEQLPAGNDQDIPTLDKNLRQAFIEAYLEAFDYREARVGIEHLLEFLVRGDQSLSSLFQELNASPEDIEIIARWLVIQEKFNRQQELKQSHFRIKLRKSIQKSTMAVATPLLNYFCTDLTEEARIGFSPVLVGREKELKEIYQTREEKYKQILLIGKTGIGKQSLVKILAERIIQDDVPHKFKNKQILTLDVNKLRGEAEKINLEKKLTALAGELIKDQSIILFIPNINSEIWNTLSGFAGRFNLIATSSQFIDNNYLKNINISIPPANIIKKVLASHSLLTEQGYKVKFLYESLALIASAGRQYMDNSSSLIHLINFLESAAQRANQQNEKIVTGKIAAEAISQIVKVPYTHILNQLKITN